MIAKKECVVSRASTSVLIVVVGIVVKGVVGKRGVCFKGGETSNERAEKEESRQSSQSILSGSPSAAGVAVLLRCVGCVALRVVALTIGPVVVERNGTAGWQVNEI
ncbi:hypothetical protein FJTKL_01157 [Diaporthe vaccinii]|uniref:Uncharacterized protein n=1 Tax=Diaporthe vaccinii TaxID=105482 RepID=A0ABR4F5N7_9PEZI